MVKGVLCIVFIGLILIISFDTHAKTIIYQPLQKDAAVPLEKWKTLIDRLHIEGYREIVIQWSQYGSVNFWQTDSFIKEPVNYALLKGFKFWLGLYLPHDYYQIMEKEKTNKNDYFDKVIKENQHLIAKLHIQNVINEDQLLGWYIPTELTHNYISAKKGVQLNLEPLKQLVELNQKPTTVSYFLDQNTSVAQGLMDLNTLKKLGVQVWLQRSNGLNKNTFAEQLLSQMHCDFGVIHENFKQTSTSNMPFSARSAVLNDDMASSCHKPIVFSLRYLPYSPL